MTVQRNVPRFLWLKPVSAAGASDAGATRELNIDTLVSTGAAINVIA